LVLVQDAELDRFRGALTELRAEQIAVPSFSAGNLRRGHAVHFRCRREDVKGLWIDVMSSLRGLPAFEDLWERRATFEIGVRRLRFYPYDLVQAKKTQRDRDWPMIRRLVEQSYFSTPGEPGKLLAEFWLQELRTPELLIEVCERFPDASAGVARPAVTAALAGDLPDVARRLDDEERAEKRLDQEYWAPLRRELEELRRARRGGA
jgi:hypothetical protein